MNIQHREDKSHIGTHIILDLWGCDYEDEANKLTGYLINAAHLSNATILSTSFHQFEPTGTTALLMLSESHISLHTWPEYDYIAIDVFTCGKKMNPQLAIDYLIKVLKPSRVETKSIKRGSE